MGCCTLERQGMGYGTRPHDWELYELESMKTLCYEDQPRGLDACLGIGLGRWGPWHLAHTRVVLVALLHLPS
jgi:hypothetical protein